MFSFDTCNAVTARENIENQILTTMAPPSWIEFDAVTSQFQSQSASDCVMLVESIT